MIQYLLKTCPFGGINGIYNLSIESFTCIKRKKKHKFKINKKKNCGKKKEKSQWFFFD